MTDPSAPRPRGLSLTDAVYGLAALAGVLVYFWLLPGQHPDAVADLSLGEEQAIEIAGQYLTESGRSVDSLTAEASFRRAERLLDSLQQDLGRPEAIRLLNSEDGAVFPAYFWQVRWYAEPGPNQRRRSQVYQLYLSQTGAVWDFNNDTQNERVRPDRKALAQVLLPEDVEAANTSLEGISDSTLEATLSFALVDTLAGREGRRSLLSLNEDAQDLTIVLDSLDVVRLARYHLSDTPLLYRSVAFQVDSVDIVRKGDPVATVYFSPEAPLHEQAMQATVVVLPTGAVKDLSMNYNPGASGGPPFINQGIVAVTMGVVYFLLFITFAVLFFRRLIGRTIDVKAALFDGIIIGLVMMAFIVISNEVISTGSDDSFWEVLVAYLIALPFLGGLVALAVFLISGATDSIARPAWPEKLESMALIRQVSLLNQRVGKAFLRGTLLAYALLGVMTLLLAALPTARLAMDRYDTLLEDVRSLVAYNYTLAGWISYVVLALALLGVGSVVYRRIKRAWVVVPAMALIVTLLQAFPQFLMPGPFTWAHTGVFALAVSYCFWRFDFLTAFIMSFFTWALWSAGSGWLVEGSPVFADFVITHGVAAGALVLGTAGIYSRRTGEEQGPYIPPYVSEMAQQERLKREVEIARDVQESFLPRQMPEVGGLDIAAMCLAAYEVGGDYYDFVKIGPGKLAVVVGDVSGKGTQAAFYMTLTKGFVQTLSREGLSPVDVMRRLNTLFCDNVPRGTFISMIYGVFDVEARTFTFARAGHNPVILKRSPSQEPDMVQPTGLAIGLVTGPPFDSTIEERTLNLRIGDVLVFYTDGFSEAMNRVKDQYGDDRLARKVGDVGQHSATEILDAIAEDVHGFVDTAERHDDMTMVVVKLDQGTAYPTTAPAHQHVVAEA